MYKTTLVVDDDFEQTLTTQYSAILYRSKLHCKFGI